MQNSLSPTTLDRVSAIFSGHMHWLQVLEFNDNALPPQLTVGHGGTKLFNSSIDEELYPHIRLVVGEPEIYSATIERGYTMNKFGYAIMERNDELNYDVTFYVFNQTTREVLEMEDLIVTIPKGPRKGLVVGTDSSSGVSNNQWDYLLLKTLLIPSFILSFTV